MRRSKNSKQISTRCTYRKNIMKNILFIVALVFASPLISKAQAKDTLTFFNQQTQAASVVQYPYSASEVTGALAKKFGKLKFPKALKAVDGYSLYKGVTIPEISTIKIDVLTKVVAQGESISSLYLILSKGYENFISKTSDPEIVANSLNFLNGFIKDLSAYRYGIEIEKQNAIIKGMDKKLESSVDENKSLERSKTKIQSKIGSLQQKSDGLRVKLETQQKLLEEVRNKKVTLEEMSALKKEVSKAESATSKARKKHEESIKDIDSKKAELEKVDGKLTENKAEQDKINAELKAEKQKLEDLKSRLAELQ